MNEQVSNTLAKWHDFVKMQNVEILDEILDDTVQFHSPFIWKPKDGKAITKKILLTVITVFENFRYVREVVGEADIVLEFEATVGEYSLRGVDLIKVGDNGKIIDFEVMVRPANALQVLGMEMGKRIQ